MTRAKGNKDFQFLGRWNNPEQVQTFRCSSSTYARKLNTKVSRRNQKIQNIYIYLFLISGPHRLTMYFLRLASHCMKAVAHSNRQAEVQTTVRTAILPRSTRIRHIYSWVPMAVDSQKLFVGKHNQGGNEEGRINAIRGEQGYINNQRARDTSS